LLVGVTAPSPGRALGGAADASGVRLLAAKSARLSASVAGSTPLRSKDSSPGTESRAPSQLLLPDPSILSGDGAGASELLLPDPCMVPRDGAWAAELLLPAPPTVPGDDGGAGSSAPSASVLFRPSAPRGSSAGPPSIAPAETSGAPRSLRRVRRRRGGVGGGVGVSNPTLGFRFFPGGIAFGSHAAPGAGRFLRPPRTRRAGGR